MENLFPEQVRELYHQSDLVPVVKVVVLMEELPSQSVLPTVAEVSTNPPTTTERLWSRNKID